MSTARELRDADYLYDSSDFELQAEYSRSRDLCFEYNHTMPSDLRRLRELRKQIIGKMGLNICITPPFQCLCGYNVELGNSFFANHNLCLLATAKVRIGDHVYIGPSVTITCATHPLYAELRRQELDLAVPITIGDDVFIGANSCILPGVTIGSRVVIGAGSVVSRDIPDDVPSAPRAASSDRSPLPTRTST